jgi:hypothetical protein
MMREAYQERVIEEKRELDVKRENLERFINGAIFLSLPPDEQERLRSQRYFMNGYSEVLGRIIEAFP